MSTHTDGHARQPKGIPTGGQFAATQREDATGSLTGTDADDGNAHDGDSLGYGISAKPVWPVHSGPRVGQQHLDHTDEVFQAMRKRPDHYGFGYLGSRRFIIDNALESGSEEDLAYAHRLTEIDQMVMQYAVDHNYSVEELFLWANSSDGRKFCEWAVDVPNDDPIAKWGGLRATDCQHCGGRGCGWCLAPEGSV